MTTITHTERWDSTHHVFAAEYEESVARIYHDKLGKSDFSMQIDGILSLLKLMLEHGVGVDRAVRYMGHAGVPIKPTSPSTWVRKGSRD